MVGLDGAGDVKSRLRERISGDGGIAHGDPWRKMSEADLNTSGSRSRNSARTALDPWIKIPPTRPERARDRPTRAETAREEVFASAECEPRREGSSKRGKLERRSPVVCESCGNESCECWRVRSPGRPRTPRTPRLQRAAASLGAQCTCEARSPRPSPQRLSPRPPVRALSAAEPSPAPPPPTPPASHSPSAWPRPLYKSASQRAICSPADPLLETTC